MENLEILDLNQNEIYLIEPNSLNELNKLKELYLNSNKVKLLQNKMFFDRAQLKILFLYQNNITNINTIPFNTLYFLKKLYLFSNKIESIKFGNFIHLSQLEELKLNQNEIGSFEVNTFIGLEKLVYLDLSANKIKILVNGAFDSLLNLQTLDLQGNDLTFIEVYAFKDLVNLISLNLDANKIYSLKYVQFNPRLDKLSLRFNMLSSLDDIHSTSLTILNVCHNRIQTISSISLLPNLEYLDISQNRLISVAENSFFDIKTLKMLNLSGNNLDLESGFSPTSYFYGQTLLEKLDLSSNDIKYLDSNITFQNLNTLKSLDLSSNKLKALNPYIFGFLSQLNVLNLSSNNLSSFLRDGCFFNLKSLKVLILASNQLKSLDFLKDNKNYLAYLNNLDLAHNQLTSIKESDFEFNPNLKFLSLNSNPIETIDEKTFEKLKFLETLKISNTLVKTLLMRGSFKELDFRNLSLSISNSENIGLIERIEIAKAKLTNVSIGLFLSQSTKYVDFSFVSFESGDFKFLNILGSSMETLKLQQINLTFIDQVSLKNLINLKHLDLSFNNLTFISKKSFEYNTKLEYLDLNSNSLYQFDLNIVLSKLRYLNLENNCIESMSDVMYDYMSIEIFKIANNQLQAYSSFEMSQVSIDVKPKFTEIYLNNNHVERIKYFSYNFGELKVANFDSNNISFIENDAFLNCRSLEVLSISENRLKYIAANNFHYLFSLLYLNLSFNEINFIESNSTVNLNKLKSLDLSFNKLFSIENDVFFGLVNLDHLNLFSQNELTFYNRSFKHLVNISTIYLNASLVLNNRCIFMHHLQREIKRNVANRYIFYKSINLITESKKKEFECDLTFHLYQFKIHLNLKTDQENDLFYTTCEEIMVKKDNNFNHNLKKCLLDHKFEESEIDADGSDRDKLNENSVQKIFSDFWYWLVMITLFVLLGPYFILILIFEYIKDFCPVLFLKRKRKDLSVRKKVNLKEFNRLINSFRKKETRSQNVLIKMARRKSF